MRISPPSQYAWLPLSKWKAEGARRKIHPSTKEGAQDTILHLKSFGNKNILQNSWNMTANSPPDLISRARGALYCFLWYSSIFFGFFFLVAPCLPLLIIHRRLYRYVLISTYLFNQARHWIVFWFQANNWYNIHHLGVLLSSATWSCFRNEDFCHRRCHQVRRNIHYYLQSQVNNIKLSA